jgi:hypothetical protein
MVQICRAYQLLDQERLEMHEQTDHGQSRERKDRRDLHHESQYLHNHQLVLPQILHQKNQDSHHGVAFAGEISRYKYILPVDIS